MPNYPSEDLKYPEKNPPHFQSPEEYGYNFDDVTILTSDNINIKGWFIKQPNTRNVPTVVFFHGNAGNIGGRLPNIEQLYENCKVNVLIIDYRGYGHSEGSPSADGLLLDARATISWAIKHPEIDDNNIFIFGRSLGGAVGIAVSQEMQDSIKGLIVENTFTSISKFLDFLIILGGMSELILPTWIGPLKYAIVPNYWPSIETIPRITIPILFISGRKGKFNIIKIYRHSDSSISNGCTLSKCYWVSSKRNVSC